MAEGRSLQSGCRPQVVQNVERQQEKCRRNCRLAECDQAVARQSKPSICPRLRLPGQQADGQGHRVAEKTLGSDGKPMAFNDAAYTLADQNVHLDKAKDWGDKALQSLEAESLKTQTEEGALKSTRDLGATWDTVGWIYFRMGEFEKAEAYLGAAFQLTQNAIVGDHLAQTYAKQGKKQQAAHTYRLAYAAAKGSDKNDIKQHYQELMGKSADPEEAPVTLKRGARDFGPEDELSRSRTHKLSSAAHSSGSATFSVVFSPGKIDDVKFVSGDQKLKPMASEIASSKVRADFPNSDGCASRAAASWYAAAWVAISPCCCQIALAPRNRNLMGGLSIHMTEAGVTLHGLRIGLRMCGHQIIQAASMSVDECMWLSCKLRRPPKLYQIKRKFILTFRRLSAILLLIESPRNSSGAAGSTPVSDSQAQIIQVRIRSAVMTGAT